MCKNEAKQRTKAIRGGIKEMKSKVTRIRKKKTKKRYVFVYLNV